MARLEFVKEELDEILQSAVGKTLGEVDSKDVFERTVTSPKITGIAGDVIEQSLLGSAANSSRDPDIIVDGVDVELKTTGIRKPKRKKDVLYEAKEPLTITAVSPPTLIEEEFEDSHFWAKVENLLLVYYEYASVKTVPASEYRNFPVQGYAFHRFSPEEIQTLKNDWELIRDYIRQLYLEHENPEEQFHTLSSALRDRLMFLDTSPKFPKPPRFRIKRSVVSNMVNKTFDHHYEVVPKKITTIQELHSELRRLTKVHKGKTISQLSTELRLKSPKAGETISKSLNEAITVRMFGAKGTKMANVDIFSKLNITAKSINLTTDGLHTEDTKLFPIDLTRSSLDETFEESEFYSSINETRFLFSVFERSKKNTERAESVFVGFKFLSLSSDLLNEELKRAWEETSSIMKEKRLEVMTMRKKNGEIMFTPKSGRPREQTNLPKSKDHTFFLRGTGRDATDKPLRINGFNIYRQDVWIRGRDLSRLLNQLTFE